MSYIIHGEPIQSNSTIEVSVYISTDVIEHMSTRHRNIRGKVRISVWVNFGVRVSFEGIESRMLTCRSSLCRVLKCLSTGWTYVTNYIVDVYI